MKKRNILISIVASIVLLFVFSTASLLTYAYFSTVTRVVTNNGDSHIAHVGMEISLLFDRIDKKVIDNNTELSIITSTSITKDENGGIVSTTHTYSTYDSNADWGSKQNPYVISNIRHLQNLSALQDIGYFNDLYIKKNYDEGGNYIGGNTPNVPYFLVCNPDGTPATIDGTNISIVPIGNDQYPFVGYVGGAFMEGTTIPNPNQGSVTANQSTIYNITVTTKKDLVDVGLFGNISYIGEKSEDETQIRGFAGVVSDLLLYDVKVRVEKPSIIDQIADFMANHLWNYSGVDEQEKDNVPNENHHIGILTGHAENATINNISVYYSSTDIVAMHVDHSNVPEGIEDPKAPNYLTTTGILGYLYNLNPVINEDGSISVGSGVSSDELSAGNGIGTGGGSLSGIGRGYVYASAIFESYHDPDNPLDKSSDLEIMTAVDEDGNPLATEYIRERLFWGLLGSQPTGNYYFYDGVFTFALSSKKGDEKQDVITSTWKEFEANGTATPKSDADEFFVGNNVDSAWKKNTTKGNSSVVAFVKDINSLSQLDTAISSGKQIYIGYEMSGIVNLMSLAQDFSTNNAVNANDNYTTISLTKSFITGDEVDSINETLDSVYASYLAGNPEPVEGMLPRNSDDTINIDVINNIDSYRVINLGSNGTDLTKIKNDYPIKATRNQDGSYVFRNAVGSNNYLALIAVRGIFTGYRYSIFTGSKKADYWGGTTSWVTNASVTEQSGGTFRIRYDYTSENAYRYVYFNNNAFKGTTNDSYQEINLHFYTVEGTSNLQFGRITYEPNTNGKTYIADKVLLWPENTYSGADGRNGGHATYSLKQLEGDLNDSENFQYENIDVLTGQEGWKNRNGENLTNSDLHNKFELAKGINFGVQFSALGGDLGSDGFIAAPVGSKGTKANIPSGSVAFQINKRGEAHIRVIVAIPQTIFYEDEDEYNLKKDELYYFGLWQLTSNGSNILSVFRANNTIEKFELPTSHTYKPSSTAGESDYILIKNSDGTISRCYLNGSQVLVAYDFVVNATTDSEIYVLGSTNDAMNIVYFSADGTASSGRDGSSGSKVDNIDFVYDYDNKIVTVNTQYRGDEVLTEEDFQYFYSTLCIIYSANGDDSSGSFPDINSFDISVRRFIRIDDKGNEETCIEVRFSGDDADYIVLARYSPYADTIIGYDKKSGGGD